MSGQTIPTIKSSTGTVFLIAVPLILFIFFFTKTEGGAEDE
ncbi:hypothetical protein [Metabacillus fastidiosus]|nr:hypothetical protein [Metabacillus fastidiosus]MED4462004.1 hypothetical protein [Metabacillus fastidiosus]